MVLALLMRRSRQLDAAVNVPRAAEKELKEDRSSWTKVFLADGIASSISITAASPMMALRAAE